MARLEIATLVLVLGCGSSSPSTPTPTPTPTPTTTSTTGTTTNTPAATSTDLGEWGRAASVPDPSGHMEGAFFTADGAPPPQACTVDADCTGNTLPATGGCCNDPTRMGAYATAYWSWIGEWRGAHCGGVTCPPPPNPVMPSECYFRVNCAEGTCYNACRF